MFTIGIEIARRMNNLFSIKMPLFQIRPRQSYFLNKTPQLI